MSINLKFSKMKTIAHIFLVFIAMQSITNAQCGINYNEILKKNCSGVYLRHQDYSNITGRDIKLVLTKDNKYAIYLLNPSKSLPKLKMSDSNPFPLQNFQESVNMNEKYSIYTFRVSETSEYGFDLDFKAEEKACVLLAIYLRNDNNYKSGIFKSFDEFKYGNPSAELNCQVINSKKNYGKGQLNYYKLDLNKKNRQALGKIFGFSDGKDIYIDITYPKLNSNPEFVKMEYLYKYCYFEYVKYVSIFTGSTGTILPSLVQKLLDINTGEVLVLNRQTLREILADDPSLSGEFNNISGKDKVLKEYLIKYLKKHNAN
jgi:hypothetical protein